jgi:hypothetical protein
LVNPGFVSAMKEIGQRVDFGNLVISVDNATFDHRSRVALFPLSGDLPTFDHPSDDHFDPDHHEGGYWTRQIGQQS